VGVQLLDVEYTWGLVAMPKADISGGASKPGSADIAWNAA